MTNRSSVKVSGFDTAKRQVKRYRRAGLCAVGPIATAIAAVLPGYGGAWAASVTTITATSAQDYVTAITDANNTGNTVTVINQYGASLSLGGASLPALTNGGLQIGDGNNDSPIAGGTITNNTTLTFVPTQGCCSSADNDTTNLVGGGAVTVKLIRYNFTWYEGFTLAGTNTYTGGTSIVGPLATGGQCTDCVLDAVTLASTAALPGYGTPAANGSIALTYNGGLATGYALDQTTLNALTANSVGFVALGADSANNLDLTNLPQVSLGADYDTTLVNPTWTYSGTLTPTSGSPYVSQNASYQYLVGGGTGTLTIASNLGDYKATPTELDAVNTGYTVLSGTNTFTGGMTVQTGVVQLATPSAYCNGFGAGCGPILIQQPGILATSYALDQTTLNAISGTSTGVVALGTDSSNNLNFSDLPNLSLGSVGGYTYSGTITPGANGYLLGGGNDPRLGGTVLTVSSVLATCLPGCGLTVNAQIYDPTYVVLTAANTYTGPTVIQADGLSLGNGATLGTISPLSAVTINSANAYLVFNEPSAITFANAIGGPGYLEQEGPGTVTLTSSAITYTGPTYIQNGTLALVPGASIASSGQVWIYGTNAPTGVLDISNAGNQTVQNLASVQNTGVPLPEVVLGANTLTDNANGNGYDRAIFGGVISGTGGFVKTGTATQVLSGTNTYSGGTTISQGTLQLGGQGYGAGAATVGTIGSGPVLDNAALVFTEPSAVTFSNVISGTGAVTQSGPGPVTLNAANTYSGGTTISAGTLVLGGGATVGTVGSGPVLDNAALVFSEPSAVTFSNAISGSGTVTQSGPGTVTVNATNTYSGGTTISAGTLVLGGATIGTVGSGPVLNSAALVFTEPSAVTFSNVIEGVGGTVTQSGPGTITLNGANTYNGLTEVKAGTLIIGDTAGNGASVGGNVQVDTGATLAGYGSLGVVTEGASLVNNGTVIPGGASGNAPGTLTETGSYTQSSGGKLLIAVTPTKAAQLNVGGSSSLAGTITFAYAAGTYVPTTYTVLASTGVITGTFGTVTEQGSVPTTLTRTVEYITGASDPAVDLVLSAPGTPTAPTVVAPLDGSLFSEQLASRTAFADARVNTLLAGGAGDNDCTAAAITPVPGQAGAPASTSAGIAALARVLCGAGGWIHADGTFLGANGSVSTPGYHADTAGFLAGIDRPVGNFGLRLGIAVGYDHDWLSDTAGGHGTVDVARFGVYAIQTVGPVLLDGAFLYGHDWTATTRPTGVGSATAQSGGNEVSGGLQASLPVPVSGFILTPVAGARFASVGTGSFVESTSGTVAGFGVSGAGATQLSAIPYARLVVVRDFATESGIGVSPYASVGYQYQAGDTQRAILLTSADGSRFEIGSTHLDRSAASLGVGIAAGRGNWSVFAGYAALVSGNWTAQQVTGGLKLVF